MKTLLAFMWAVLLFPTLCLAAPVQWTIAQGGNDHWYERIDLTGLTWTQANAAASTMAIAGLPGHLATLTSQEENQWVELTFPNTSGFWIGGYQPDGSVEPAGGWAWVTGEPWVYTNWGCPRWGTIAPHNSFLETSQTEGYLELSYFGSDSSYDWGGFVANWNDMPNAPIMGDIGMYYRPGFLVEYEPTIVDAPAINWGNVKSLFR